MFIMVPFNKVINKNTARRIHCLKAGSALKKLLDVFKIDKL